MLSLVFLICCLCTVPLLNPMELHASTVDEADLEDDSRTFSYATDQPGVLLTKEMEMASERKRLKKDVSTGQAQAREARQLQNAELGKFFMADVTVPIKMLSPPEPGMAYRDFDPVHAQEVADGMQTAGKNYPNKPAVACMYKVLSAQLILARPR